METVKEHLQIRDKKEFIKGIEKAMQDIENYVAKNDYQFSKPLDYGIYSKLTAALDDVSLRKRKVMRRYMYKIEHHATLDVVNKFLHFFYKNVLKSDERVKVLKSNKEQQIIKARLEFKAALKVLLEKREAYKTEKGDFYKVRLSKNQAI